MCACVRACARVRVRYLHYWPSLARLANGANASVPPTARRRISLAGQTVQSEGVSSQRSSVSDMTVYTDLDLDLTFRSRAASRTSSLSPRKESLSRRDSADPGPLPQPARSRRVQVNGKPVTVGLPLAMEAPPEEEPPDDACGDAVAVGVPTPSSTDRPVTLGCAAAGSVAGVPRGAGGWGGGVTDDGGHYPKTGGRIAHWTCVGGRIRMPIAGSKGFCP